jgi:hypothetical protein
MNLRRAFVEEFLYRNMRETRSIEILFFYGEKCFHVRFRAEQTKMRPSLHILKTLAEKWKSLLYAMAYAYERLEQALDLCLWSVRDATKSHVEVELNALQRLLMIVFGLLLWDFKTIIYCYDSNLSDSKLLMRFGERKEGFISRAIWWLKSLN